MGNIGSSISGRRRRRSYTPPPQPPPMPPPPDSAGNRYVFAAATPYPSQYPNPNPPGYYPYHGYYPQQPVPGPYGPPYPNWAGGQYPCGAVPTPVTPYVEHQKAVTIRNDVNVKKETLQVEPDEDNPGKYLISFTFDATAPGSITLIFFAKETEGCNLIATRESLLKPVTVDFKQGLGQNFRQPSGTGVDSLMLEEMDAGKNGDVKIYPLVVKAEACPLSAGDTDSSSARNSQITQAVIEKGKDEHKVRVVKQILWVNGMRYELQEIYGIGNAVEGDFDGNDSGKDCVICLSEPRDTAVLPCRHMCMCSGCAKVLRFQTSRCPICRQMVERLLEIKVNDSSDDSGLASKNNLSQI